MNVVALSLTEAGAALARRLPYRHRAGNLMAAVREEWEHCDALVLIASTGIAVRAVAPLLEDKDRDPAVVCVDDAGRHAVALVGGHRAGANSLTREIAAALSATAVVSTATDLAGLPALDQLPSFTATGGIATVTRQWLDGYAPSLSVDPDLGGWPVPGPLQGLPEAAAGTAIPAGTDTREAPVSPRGAVTITDSARAAARNEVLLRPRSLVVGVGSSRGADPEALAATVDAVLAGAGRAGDAVGVVASADIKADEPAIVALAAYLGVPLVTFPAPSLAVQEVPNPSRVVSDAVGTPSVAEAAAILAGGPGARLLVEKTVSPTGDSTVALARRAAPAGHLWVVGLGPGAVERRTPEAAAAVRHADVVIGYGPYVDQAGDLLGPGQEVIRSPIGAEAERSREALERAAGGARVALVCSGDAGVYAMASLVCELAPDAGSPPLTVVPGVTAALAGAAVLGAPLGHDHAAVSLSDLLTPWEVITRRLQAVAEGDFVVSLYNPKSLRRVSQLPEALSILSAHRPPATPAAVLTDIGRPGQHVTRTTLAELDPGTVGMLSLVVIGSSRTRWIGGRMVTPRGYLG